MKRSRRFLFLVTAAIPLAALALASAACPRPPESVRPPNVVTVIVTYDPVTRKAEMALTDKTIKLSERFKDRIQWVSPDGIVHVKFTKDSPFDKDPIHEKKVLKSIHPKSGSAHKVFEYTAELELSEGSRVSIDPKIEVMD